MTGVREFEGYFALLRESGQAPATPDAAAAAVRGQGPWPAGKEGLLLQQAVAGYVASTSRLARRQRRRLRSLSAAGEWTLQRLDATPVFHAMYGAPGTGEAGQAGQVWSREVLQPAQATVAAFLAGEGDTMQGESLQSAARPNLWVQRTCEVRLSLLSGLMPVLMATKEMSEHPWHAHV